MRLDGVLDGACDSHVEVVFQIGDHEEYLAGLSVSEITCDWVDLIIEFLDSRLDRFPCFFFHVGAVVDDVRDGGCGYPSQFCHVFHGSCHLKSPFSFNLNDTNVEKSIHVYEEFDNPYLYSFD